MFKDTNDESETREMDNALPLEGEGAICPNLSEYSARLSDILGRRNHPMFSGEGAIVQDVSEVQAPEQNDAQISVNCQ